MSNAFKRWAAADFEEKCLKLFSRLRSIKNLGRLLKWNISVWLRRDEITCKFRETFHVSIQDMEIGKLLYTHGGFDFSKFEKVSRLLDLSNRTLVDVGANYGSICIPAIKRGYVRDSIAIEADQKTFSFLERNIESNGITTIQTLNIVAGAKNEMLLFGQKERNSGDSKVVNEQNKEEFSNIVEMPVTSLDILLKGRELNELLLWVDVQGFELSVLEGALGLIENRTPIVIEIFPLGLMSYQHKQDLFLLFNNYRYFANLRYNIIEPKFEPIDFFQKEYQTLSTENSYSDFLFI
jgi:FkbM family methyltransferase